MAFSSADILQKTETETWILVTYLTIVILTYLGSFNSEKHPELEEQYIVFKIQFFRSKSATGANLSTLLISSTKPNFSPVLSSRTALPYTLCWAPEEITRFP